MRTRTNRPDPPVLLWWFEPPFCYPVRDDLPEGWYWGTARGATDE